MGAVVEEARRLSAKGFVEIVLTGVDLTSYGADLIAGFPTETEEMFENSLKLIDDAGLTFLHVFPFSARKGTPAARMPQLDRGVVKERAARLRAKGAEAAATRMASLVGTAQNVLMEKSGLGRTPCFAPVKIEKPLVLRQAQHEGMDQSAQPFTLSLSKGDAVPLHTLHITGATREHLVA
jgi:tRNA A37 methylthiotransferase MiaB